MSKVFCGFAVSVVAVLVAGCETGGSYPNTFESNSSVFAVEPEKMSCGFSDETGASRRLEVRNGKVIGFHGLRSPVTLTCEQEGYHPYTTVVRGRMSDKAGGFVLLFGGVAGAMNHAARGVGVVYPKEVRVRLEPRRFASLEARDAWYDVRRAEVAAERREAHSFDRRLCDENTGCAELDSNFESKLAVELKAMDERRMAAEIAPD